MCLQQTIGVCMKLTWIARSMILNSCVVHHLACAVQRADPWTSSRSNSFAYSFMLIACDQITFTLQLFHSITWYTKKSWQTNENQLVTMAPNAETYIEKIPKQRGRCTSCLCMSWKVFTCILSHVTLITMVIAYCLMGSYAFEWLEADNERQMKTGVKYIRGNFSHELWDYTQKVDYLSEQNWTEHAGEMLLKFEEKILDTMKTGGWDGVENPDRLQWTRMGALFYSIIVITTIGELNKHLF